MMYAYVKFLEGPNTGRKRQVSVDVIKYKFNEDATFNDSKKYRTKDHDGKYYRAQIILLEKSQTELEQKLLTMPDKRTRTKPDAILDTATDTDDCERDMKKYKTCAFDNASEKLTRHQNYTSLLNIKLEKNAKAKNYAKEKTESACSDQRNIDECSLINTSSNTKGKRITHAKEDILKASTNQPSSSQTTLTEMYSEPQQQQKRHLKILEDIQVGERDIDNLMQSESFANKDHNDAIYDSGGEITDVEGTKMVNQKLSILENSSPVSKMVSVQHVAKYRKIIEKLQKENENMKSQLKQTQKDNERLQKKVTDAKSVLKEIQAEAEDYKNKNKKLQEIIIDKFEEQNIIKEQLEDVETSMDHKLNFVPVGKQRMTDGMIHIGRNQWLSKVAYHRIMTGSSSPSHCVSNTLIAVFGEETMRNSTATGRGSNASDKKNVQYQKLDPELLAVCKDLFEHWLNTEYPKKVPNHFKIDVKAELKDFNTYVSRKAAYEKKFVNKPKGDTQKKRKGEVSITATPTVSQDESINIDNQQSNFENKSSTDDTKSDISFNDVETFISEENLQF